MTVMATTIMTMAAEIEPTTANSGNSDVATAVAAVAIAVDDRRQMMV